MRNHSKLRIFCTLLLSLFIGIYASAQAQKKHVRMGLNKRIFLGLSPGDAKLATQQIVKLAGFNQYELESFFLQDENEFFEAINEERVDFFPIMAHHYVTLSKTVEMAPAAVPLINGESPYTQLVLLTANPELDLNDATNKTLFIDGSRSQGLEHIWLENILLDAGLGTTSEVFSDVTEVDKSNKAILPTFFGKSDFCVVPRENWEILAELNPQLSSKLRVVAESSPLLPLLLAFRKDFDPPSQKRFVEEVTEVHKTTEGKQILTLSKCNRIAEFKEEWLTSVIRLMEQNASLKKQRNESKEAAE